MKTKKYALLMALASLGTGSVVFASAAEPDIDFDNIGSNDLLEIGLKHKSKPYNSTNEKEVKEKIKKKLSDRLGCDTLAVLAGDNNCAEWMKNLASEVLSSKKPIEFSMLNNALKNPNPERGKKSAEAFLYTYKTERDKYSINNYHTYNKVAYNFFDEKCNIVSKALLDLKSESDRRIEEMRSQSPTSHSSNSSFKTEDTSPPPSSRNNSVDISNLDFSDFEKINTLYWDSFRDLNADPNIRDKLAQKLKDFLNNTSWEKLCEIYKNVEKSSSSNLEWYNTIILNVIFSKKEQHLREFKSQCDSMDVKALEVALSKAKKKKSQGNPLFEYIEYNERYSIETVLRRKEDEQKKEFENAQLEYKEKIAREHQKMDYPQEDKEAAPKIPEVDRPDWMEIEERIREGKKRFDERKWASHSSPDSEPKSKYKSPKKGLISPSIYRYLSSRIKNDRIKDVLLHIKKGAARPYYWEELKNYLYSDFRSADKIKQMFRGLKSRNSRILNEKYRFLNSLIPFSKGGSDPSFKHFINDMAKEDAHLFPLRACAYDLRNKFANSDGSLSHQESNILEDFSRNDMLFTEYTNDLMDLYTSTIEDIIHAETEEQDPHGPDEKQQKIKKIISQSIKNKPFFIKKIKDFQRENDVECSNFLNILKSLEKENRRNISETEEDPEAGIESQETNNAEDESTDVNETKSIKKTDAKKTIALKKVGAKNNKKIILRKELRQPLAKKRIGRAMTAAA